MTAWADPAPLPAVRVIGRLEVLGAIGLLLPPPTGIASRLTPAATTAFLMLQIRATAAHLRIGDHRIARNITLILIAAVTAWLATSPGVRFTSGPAPAGR